MIVCSGNGANNIHSEYGMTELLSQAYSAKGIIFAADSMQVLMEENDPLLFMKKEMWFAGE
jgi:hypothetical protein